MTDFRQDKAIYLQMYERVCDDILSGRYGPGDRIPSVRELSEQLEVNTNTVVRAYDQLVRREIVHTRRGMGYFVSDRAREIILAERRREFMDEQEGLRAVRSGYSAVNLSTRPDQLKISEKLSDHPPKALKYCSLDA